MIRHHLATGEVVKDIKNHVVKIQEAKNLYESMAERRYKDDGKKEQNQEEHS